MRTLKLPARTLNYGLYKFHLNVTMVGEPIWDEDYVIIEIGELRNLFLLSISFLFIQ